MSRWSRSLSERTILILGGGVGGIVAGPAASRAVRAMVEQQVLWRWL
jgi:hypothetical protein